MKILIADDDSLARSVVQRVVAQLGHDCIEAVDGLDALRMIEHDDPDVLVTDLRMPVLDGFELVEALRSSSRYRGMPIICLSAVSDRDAIARLATFGITDYLLKPIRPRDFADRVQGVATKHAKWKLDRTPSGVASTAAAVLVIDPDVGFRSFVTSVLAPEFGVIEAASGANGLTLFRSRSAPVAAVLVSEGLDLLGEARLADLLRRISLERGATARPVLLMAVDDAIDADKAAHFDGIVRRSPVADEFLAAVARWLPKEALSPTH